MEKILAAGASIIIRPTTADGFRNFNCKYVVAIELHGIRNGLMGDNLDDIFRRAFNWVEEVDFIHGSQWTVEQVSQMRDSAA